MRQLLTKSPEKSLPQFCCNMIIDTKDVLSADNITKIQKYQNTEIPKYRNIKIQKYQKYRNTKIQKYPNTETSWLMT